MSKKASKILLSALIAAILIFSFVACNGVEFKIEFIVEGEVYATVNTNGEETVKMPADPVRDGYIFDGWYWDEGEWKRPFTANSLLDTPLSESMKVYAKWTSGQDAAGEVKIDGFERLDGNVFACKVDNEQTSISLVDAVTVDSSSSWVLTSDIEGKDVIPSKTVSLREGDNTCYVLVTDKDGNVALYELTIRRKPLYDVVFDTAGGGDIPAQKVQEDDFVDAPAQPQKTGYEFVGWDRDLSKEINGNTVITAQWKAKTYTVTFHTGDDSVSVSPLKVAYKTSFTLPVPDRTGYNFDGWYLDGVKVENGVWVKDESVTLSAKWSVREYTVDYYLDGGQNSALNATGFVIDDLPVQLYDATKPGYDFVGWYYGDYSQEVTSIDVCDDVELYAVFKIKGLDYTAAQDGSYIVSGYDGTADSLVLDDTFKGKEVTEIGDGAFENCDNLTFVSVGENTLKIGQRAFSGCGALTSVVIPASVKTIGSGAFELCDALTAVYYEAQKADWDELQKSDGGLQNATVYYYSETQPADIGNYWHYVNGNPVVWQDVYTYNTYTAVSPTDWNTLTYSDSNDEQIIKYINSPFFEFDFKFDGGEIVPGDYEVEYSAATALEDVTAKYAAEYGYGEGDKGYAWKITLRDDLVWDDGTPIKAEDFVYSLKEQLNPDFALQNAQLYCGSSISVRNARSYFMQGQTVDEQVSVIFGTLSEAYAAGYGNIYLDITMVNKVFINVFSGSYDQAKAAGYLDMYFTMYDDNGQSLGQNFFEKYDLEAAPDGQIKVTEEMIADYGKCRDREPVPDEELAELSVIKDYYYVDIGFEQVGIFTGADEYEIILCLDQPIELLKEDGSLSYIAAYQFNSLPLVKEDLYEACKKAPAYGSNVWTTDYGTSVETTASWGPYKLTEYIEGERYVLERNENWYGYTANLYPGQYQTDAIVCETIGEWETAWLKFQKGEIDGVSMDEVIAPDYKLSERAYFTPTDEVDYIYLQSDAQALEEREQTGINKTILTYPEFRKALSLGIDRVAYAHACTTSSLAGFGLFNSMHYYDVENGLAYRESDAAKQVLCDVYGVDVNDFASLDEAVDSITGYDLDKARELVNIAYEKALADGKISDTDRVVLVYGAITDSVANMLSFNYISLAWTELMQGTRLEGRFTLQFDAHYGFDANAAFRNGNLDVYVSGWVGAAWDPGSLLQAHIDPDYRLSCGWDTYSEQMTFTMPVPQQDGTVKDTELTMSLMDWFNCLNGLNGIYDWSANAVSQEVRLPLIAALEKRVLLEYYDLPLYNIYSASLVSYKVDNITDEYNTFMEFGGIRYMTYNYTDEQWENYVNEHNGALNYK